MLLRLLRKLHTYRKNQVVVPESLSMESISVRSGVPLELVLLFDSSLKEGHKDGRGKNRGTKED